MRYLLARIAAVVMAVTGYRFDKSFRHAEQGWRAATYRVLGSTVMANYYADDVCAFFVRGR
jgi:hypothetical protein